MQVIFHAGAHGTEADRLIKSLLRNREALLREATLIPAPGRYRSELNNRIDSARTSPPAQHAIESLASTIREGQDANRVVLSNTNFLGFPGHSIQNNALYPDAEDRLLAIKSLFPTANLELYLSIRSPIGFIPALAEAAHHSRRSAILNDTDYTLLSWADLLIRIRGALPDMPITVWCHEDSPLIWSEVIRRLAGLDLEAPIKGGFDILSSIMSQEGMKRLRAYLAKHPDMTEAYKRKVIVAFLDKYAQDEELEEELTLPSNDPLFSDEVEEIYDEDVARIAQIPGVTLIQT